MRYTVMVETRLGEVLAFPHYTATERILAMRVARSTSLSAAAAWVLDGTQQLVRYERGLAVGHMDPVVWHDARQLKYDDPIGRALLPDPDYAWERAYRHFWDDDEDPEEVSGR